MIRFVSLDPRSIIHFSFACRYVTSLLLMSLDESLFLINCSYTFMSFPSQMDDDDDEEDEDQESKPASSSVPEIPKSWNLEIPLPIVHNPSCKQEASASENRKIILPGKRNITKRSVRQAGRAEETDFDDREMFRHFDTQTQTGNIMQNQHPFYQSDPTPGHTNQRHQLTQSSPRISPMNQNPYTHMMQATPGPQHNPNLRSFQVNPVNIVAEPSAHDDGDGREEDEERAAPTPRYRFNYDIPKDSFQSQVVNGQFSTFAKLPNDFQSLIQSDTSFLDSLSEYPSTGSGHQDMNRDSHPDSHIESSGFGPRQSNDHSEGEETAATPSAHTAMSPPAHLAMSQAIRSIHNRQFGSRAIESPVATVAQDERIPAASGLQNRMFRRMRRPSGHDRKMNDQQTFSSQTGPQVHRYERRMLRNDDEAEVSPKSSEQQFLRRLADYEDNYSSDDGETGIEYPDPLPVSRASNFNWQFGTTTTTPAPTIIPPYATPAPPPTDQNKEIIAQVRVIKNGLLENIRRQGEISVRYLSEPAGPPPPSYPTSATNPPHPRYATPEPTTAPPPPPPQYTSPAPAYQPPAPIQQWYTTPPPPPPQYPTTTPPPPPQNTYPPFPALPPVYFRPVPPAPTYPPPPTPPATPAPQTYWQTPPPTTTTTPAAPYAWLDESENLPPSQLPKVVYAIMMMDKTGKRGRRRVSPQ